MMERNYYVRQSRRVALNRLSRGTYKAPQIMGVVSHEPIMAAAGSNVSSGPGQNSKQQDSSLFEDLDSLDELSLDK